MTLAALLALLTSALFGTSDFLASAMSRRLPGPAVALWSQLAGGAVLAVLLVLSGQGFNGAGVLWGMAGGIVAAAGVLVFYRAFSLGSTSIVTSLAAGGVALPVLWGIAGGESPSAVGILGLAVVVAGLASLSSAGDSGDEHPAVTPPCPSPAPRSASVRGNSTAPYSGPPQLAVPLALLAAACFGAYFILLDLGTSSGDGVLWVSAGVQAGALVTTVGFAAFTGLRKAVRVDPDLLLPVFLIGLLEVAGDVALTYATVLGQLGVVSVLASLDVLFTAVLARFLLGERLSRLGTIGVTLLLAGVVMISV